MGNMDFKERFPIKQRQVESTRILEKYPDRIPIICQRTKTDKLLTTIDKAKYLVPSDLTCGQFTYVIRKRIKLNPETAMFLFLESNILPPASATMKELYYNHVNADGFMYIYYGGENTFG